MKIIECHQLMKNYIQGGVAARILKNLSLSITTGEFVAIMGPSGSGKSTLMHILGLLDTPTAGDYKLDGQNVSRASPETLAIWRREKIGFVFQSFNLLNRMTVWRNVLLPLIYTGVAVEDRSAKVAKSLQAAGLPRDRWYYLPNQLSGGQAQRAAIARALVNDPALILADEPTGNLDFRTGEIVLKTFRRLNREQGRTIILITHEKYVAEHADRLIYLKDGRLVDY